MAYQKKKIPREVRALRDRLNRIRHITEQFEWNPQELIDESERHLQSVEETVDAYNAILAEADALRDTINQQTLRAQDLHARLRMAVIGRYGRGSRAYRMLGGVPPSEIDYGRKTNKEEEE